MGRYHSGERKNLDVNQVKNDINSIDGSGSLIDATTIGNYSKTERDLVKTSEVITFASSITQSDRPINRPGAYVKIENGFVNLYITDKYQKHDFLENEEQYYKYNFFVYGPSGNLLKSYYHYHIIPGVPFTLFGLPTTGQAYVKIEQRIAHLRSNPDYSVSKLFNLPATQYSIDKPAQDLNEIPGAYRYELFPDHKYTLTPFNSTMPNDKHTKTIWFLYGIDGRLLKTIIKTEGNLRTLEITPELAQLEFKSVFVYYYGLYGSSE